MLNAIKWESTQTKVFIQVVDPLKNLWGVYESDTMRLSRSNGWSYVPLPSARSDEWIKNHSFTWDEARTILALIDAEVQSKSARKIYSKIDLT